MDAGLPSSNQLTQRLLTTIENDGDVSLQRALGLILGGLALRRGVNGERIDQPVDVETVLRIAEQLEGRTKHPLSDYVASWNASLERLAPGGDGVIFRRLIEAASAVLQQALQTPDDRTLVKYLAGVCRLRQPWMTAGKKVTAPRIFTLNYDRCLETALEYDGSVQYTTGFRDGLWNETEFQKDDIVRLYKLHGSFGWVRDPQRSLLYDRQAALLRQDIDIVSGETPDELIFGAENKLQATQPYLWLVHQFAEAVKESKYVVVIGYGFGDQHINQIIGQAMSGDATKRLIVVTPHFHEEQVEHATGFSYYPERTSPLEHGAKEALHDRDTIVTCLTHLQEATAKDEPF